MSYLEELLPEFRKVYVLGEVKGNKFHFVTPNGQVLSFSKDKPIWRKPTPDKDGYLCVGIKINGKNTTRKIHRLVAEAFIPNPENNRRSIIKMVLNPTIELIILSGLQQKKIAGTKEKY